MFKQGKGYREGFLFLKIEKNNLKTARFGFIVSKKISNKAVIRNKVKRRLRAIVYKKIPLIKKGIDVVIITQPGIEKKSFQELEENVAKIFSKAKCLKN